MRRQRLTSWRVPTEGCEMTQEEIRELRKKRGWTQQRLATEVGVAVSSVARWESRAAKPPKGAAHRALQRLLAERPSGPGPLSADMHLPAEKMERVEALRAEMRCSKDFQCVESGFAELCKAQDIGLDSHLECLDPGADACLFSAVVESRHLCQCPLRVFLAKQLQR